MAVINVINDTNRSFSTMFTSRLDWS